MFTIFSDKLTPSMPSNSGWGLGEGRKRVGGLRLIPNPTLFGVMHNARHAIKCVELECHFITSGLAG